MRYDLVLGGVGGQGILSIAFVVDNSAMHKGLHFKQSEVHGMAQRGGAVSSYLRISDEEIFSDIVSLGKADLLLSVEPMEALRYMDYRAPDGRVVASTTPEVNIPDYPEVDRVIDTLAEVPGSVLVAGKPTAKEAGSHRAQNMVVLGAASPYLPLEPETMEHFIEVLFSRKGEKLVNTNLRAFRFGRARGQLYRSCVDAGADPRATLRLLDHMSSDELEVEAAGPWSQVLTSGAAAELDALWQADPERCIPGTREIAEKVQREGVPSLKQLAG
jgi:indolepyruvate ferredoxin oxidoreductase beta subunit